MIKRLLLIDGVDAVCHFRDDGSFVEGFGFLDESGLRHLARFALEYRRLVQGNLDQFSMFTGLPGWTPPRAWAVRAAAGTVLSVGNLVCLARTGEVSINRLLAEMTEAASYV